jgi:hypothetical protein
MAGSKLPGELTWPKLLGTTIAAVVAAWLGGHLGLGGTLTGVAIGSVIATFGSAFFTSSINKSHQAIIVRTERGTVVEAPADSDAAGPSGGTAVLPAPSMEPYPPAETHAPSRLGQIDWRAVAVAALLTMAVTLAVISLYEGAVGRTLGSNEPGTTIGNTVHGGQPVIPTPTPSETPTQKPTSTPTPSETPSASPTPTPSPTSSPSPTPSPSPSASSTPTPSGSPTGLPLIP